MDWVKEIDELHAFFAARFAGQADGMGRFVDVLDQGFTIVGPNGDELGRAETIELVEHAATPVSIETKNHRLLYEDEGSLVASYVEEHSLRGESTRRISTVVFRKDQSMPNGLAWVRVHETWLES